MAKLIGSVEIETDYTLGREAWMTQEEQQISDYRATLTNRGSVIGKVVQYPIADGYAQYMVVKEKPLQLVHLSVGDGYQIPDAHLRGLKLSDIIAEIRRQTKMAELFS